MLNQKAITRISNFGTFCIFLFLLFISCDSFDFCDGSVSPLDSRIMFSVGEDHDCFYTNCEPSIVLRMETEKDYGCCNYSIETGVFVMREAVYVSLKGIYKPSLCLTSIGPACSARYLQLSPGIYSLNFLYDDRVEAYELVITDDAIRVEGGGFNLTKPTARLTWRYPSKSFAYLCGSTIETSWICDDFADSLLSTGLFSEFSFPDSGQIPYRVSSGGHYYDMPGRYFLYQNETDFDTAGAVLERYAKEVTSQYVGNGITLRNWTDRWFVSWMLED